MTHLAPKPVVQRLTKPVSLVMFIMREGMDPSPPAPALLTLERSVSAGWEMTAEQTPAMTPEPKLTPVFRTAPHFSGFVFMPTYIFSATRPCTANLAIV